MTKRDESSSHSRVGHSFDTPSLSFVIPHDAMGIGYMLHRSPKDEIDFGGVEIAYSRGWKSLGRRCFVARIADALLGHRARRS